MTKDEMAEWLADQEAMDAGPLAGEEETIWNAVYESAFAEAHYYLVSAGCEEAEAGELASEEAQERACDAIAALRRKQ